jgi:hypothetical protein
LEVVAIIVTAVERRFEGIEAVVIPFGDGFLGASGDKGHMDADCLGLANAIKATDALFYESGIERQVEQHEVMRELEIAPFAADFGTEQELSAIGLGKPRSLAIALHERQPFVKEAEIEIEALFYGGFEGENFELRFADEQNFLAWILFE